MVTKNKIRLSTSLWNGGKIMVNASQYIQTDPIIIRQKDSSNLKIITQDKNLILKIHNHFSYFVDGYMFMPLYKMGRWDGKNHLFDFANKELPYGLLDELKQFCDERGVVYNVQLLEEHKTLITYEELDKFMGTLELPKDMEVRDYQRKMIYECINQRRITAISSTSSGKSLVIYVIVRWMLEHDQKCFIIVPNVSLVHQMRSDFISYNWEEEVLDKLMHVIYSGQEKLFNKPVILTTWQSVYKKEVLTAYKDKYDCIIVDEAHKIKVADGQKIGGILMSFENSKFKIGVTGSLPKQELFQKQIIGCLGPVTKIIDAAGLVEAGHATDLDITSIYLKHNKGSFKLFKKQSAEKFSKGITKNYLMEESFVNTSDLKQEFICKLVSSKVKKGENIIVFFKRIQYGKALLEKLQKLFPDKVQYVDGSVDGKVREGIRKNAEIDSGAVLVCSYATFGTGINIKKIHSGIFAENPGKSDITLIQSLGRFLRQHVDKEKAYIYDIVDVFDDIDKIKVQNYMLKHFNERIEVYRDQGWFITEKNYEL